MSKWIERQKNWAWKENGTGGATVIIRSPSPMSPKQVSELLQRVALRIDAAESGEFEVGAPVASIGPAVCEVIY
jgi:hypothetical protein